MSFYAQHGEDSWIVQNLPLPVKGFYVDIGCGHPTETSNTAFLRDLGWHGLAIDGNRQWAKDWEQIPGFYSAVISSTPNVPFLEDSWWSRVVAEGGELRETETIEELLARFEIGQFDFLSVDTEGTEHEILASFDFKKHNPSIVIAEYNSAHVPVVAAEDSVIPYIMAARGYRLAHVFEPTNMIFTR